MQPTREERARVESEYAVRVPTPRADNSYLAHIRNKFSPHTGAELALGLPVRAHFDRGKPDHANIVVQMPWLVVHAAAALDLISCILRHSHDAVSYTHLRAHETRHDIV